MKRILLMFAVLLIASCEQSPIVEQSMLNQPEDFWATFEGADESDTRTYLDDQARMRWTADDRLTIFKKTTYNREFAFTGKTGANAGGFKQVSVDDDFWFGYDVDYNYAIYPHSAANEFDETDCFFTTTMPAEQTYVENSFGLGANTMVAASESGQLIFKNVGSYLRVMLWGENQTVKKITLSSIAGEALAGEAKIFATLADAPTCTMIDDISSITLTCETPVEINATEEEQVAFWIVVPPVVLSEGYTVTVENAEGETQTYEVNKEKTFKRNVYNTLRRELTIGVVEEPTVPANNEIWYTTSDGAPIVFKDSTIGDVNIISNTYENGKGVISCDGDITEIYSGLFNRQPIVTVTLPASVTSINGSTFQKCSSLTSVVIPEGVANIGIAAFIDCSALTSITLPQSLTTIADGVFSGCTSLSEFVGKYASSDGRCLIVDSYLTSFAPADVTTYTIPEGVTIIGKGAFDRCTSLTSITIPDNVLTIESGAFADCATLASVTLSKNLTSIGKDAFGRCASLTSVTIPDKVTTIGNEVFAGCTSLASVAIDGELTDIGTSVFSGCTSLKEFSGKCASSDGRCLIVNDTLCYFAPAELTSYTIPEGIKTIGQLAFSRCTSLASIVIPEDVTTIGASAFSMCESLESVYCEPTTPPTGYSNMFYYNATDRKIYVPASSDDSILNAYKTATGWSEYADHIVETEEALINNKIVYTSTDGKIVSPYTYATDAFGDANIVSNTYENGQGVITFDAELTTIGERAFFECSTLKTVTIPDSVTSLGQYAFKYCTSLMSVTLPNSLSSIGMETFYNCTALKSITIPDSVTHIGYYAFQYCRALQNVVMGNSVKTIANYAFDWCEALTSVTIPDSVTSIGIGAFRNCTSLKDVYCFAVTPPTLGNEYVFSNNASGRKIYVQIVAYDAYKAASIWSGYSIIADYTPTECTSLTIEADDVPGYMTSTTIRYSAMTNGMSFNRYQVKDIPMTGEVTSSQFDMNTSLTESVERTISFSYLGRSATTTITQGPSLAKSYTIDLNNQWRNSTAPNPDSALYDGVYESFSNYHSNRGNAEMRIEIIGYEEFSIYVRCDSEVADYLKIYLDSTFIMDTAGDESSDTSFSGYTEVKFSSITPGPHTIRIVYDKDESDHEGADRGYVFIPKNQ